MVSITGYISSIPSHLCYSYNNLTNFTINSTFTINIEKNAFYNCTSLSDISGFDKVTSIEKYAFYNCVSLKEIDFSQQTLSISDSAFESSGLSAAFLPSSLTEIGNKAFANSAIETLTFDISLKIGEYAFCNCTKLKKVIVQETKDLKLSTIFEGCSSLEEVTVPEAYCGQFFCGKYIYIFTSNWEFHSNTGELNVKYSEKTQYDMKNSDWQGIRLYVSSVTIGKGYLVIRQDAFSGFENLKDITISTSVKYIEQYAFKDCISLEQILLPSSIGTIYEGAFYNCSRLAHINTVTINNSLPNIDKIAESVFDLCISLHVLNLPQALKTIKTRAFCGSGLDAIVIPFSVNVIEDDAFADCANLVSASYEGISDPGVDSDAFKGSALTSVNVPYGYKSQYFCGLQVIEGPAPSPDFQKKRNGLELLFLGLAADILE